MVVIRYLTSPPTPGTLRMDYSFEISNENILFGIKLSLFLFINLTAIAEDWNSISGTAIPSLPVNLNMFSDS